jgi:hypothetical protein
MDINMSGVTNVTNLSGGVNNSDIHILVFVGFIGVLVLSVPFIIGKNGNIHSRDWFNRRE